MPEIHHWDGFVTAIVTVIALSLAFLLRKKIAKTWVWKNLEPPPQPTRILVPSDRLRSRLAKHHRAAREWQKTLASSGFFVLGGTLLVSVMWALDDTGDPDIKARFESLIVWGPLILAGVTALLQRQHRLYEDALEEAGVDYNGFMARAEKLQKEQKNA